MKTFHLLRHEDKSGVSGTGIVAEGVVFSTGKVSLGWLTLVKSVAVYDSIEDCEVIHGHNGATQIVWQD